MKLRVLMAEDSEQDAELVLRELRRGGYDVVHTRVETAEQMRAQLDAETWDVILSDWSMPKFSALAALEVVKQASVDIPFIILSGTIGEDTASQALRAGAHDFLLKDRLARLIPAIDRELREVGVRRQQRQAEHALGAIDARFRTLVESMDEMVFTLDSQHRYDGVFGRWVELGGKKPEDYLGKTMRDVFGDEAAPHEAAIREAWQGRRALYEWSSSDGERWFQTSLSPIRSAQGEITGLVGVGREITEQRRVQAQLVVSDRLVSVGMLAAGVAHEVNNPLTAVVANLELAIRDLRNFTAEQGVISEIEDVVEELEDARESAERIREISRDLRLFSRAEEEKRGPVDLYRVIESSLRMAWNEIRHRARLVKEYRQRPIVEGNESRLGQVFLNLIMNAAQAIPMGQVDANEIRVTTRLSSRGWAEVEIRDTGSGIPPDVLKRLFTPFFTTKPAGVGTGLGLSICQRIVASHGGEISVDSTVGQGTAFTVSLPASGSQAASTDVPRTVAEPQRRGRILVVDDEPAIIAVTRRLLSTEHEVEGTDDARTVVERISAGERFDVILCDVMMPKMSGLELYQQLRIIDPAHADRVMFLTGGVFNPEVREFLDGLSNLRIEKPFDPMALRALINDRLKDMTG